MTPERRQELRQELGSPRPGWVAVDRGDVLALLDTADDRDRLVEAVEAVTALLDEESNENKRLREEMRRLEGNDS